MQYEDNTHLIQVVRTEAIQTGSYTVTVYCATTNKHNGTTSSDGHWPILGSKKLHYIGMGYHTTLLPPTQTDSWSVCNTP